MAVTAAAAGTTRESSSSTTIHDSRPAAVEHCPGAQRAITHYRQRYRQNRSRMGLSGPVSRVWYGCDAAARRAREWRHRAADAAKEVRRWINDQWNWRAWLPRGWYGIGSCETGYGGDPNWHHNSGAYQGAFGFARKSWDDFRVRANPRWGPYPSEAYEATPRQQFEVALAIFREYGLSGWGCRGAYYG